MAVVNIRFLRGVIPAPVRTSAGSQVSSDPVSTSASSGCVTISSRFGLRAVTLTLNILIGGNHTTWNASHLLKFCRLLQDAEGFRTDLHFHSNDRHVLAAARLFGLRGATAA